MAATTPTLASSLLGVAFLTLAVWLGWTSIQSALRRDLRKIPGPLLAKVSRLYQLSLVLDGQAPENYRRLHRHHGSIVRIAPNHVSVSDPAAIPILFGVSSKFLKTDFYKTMTPVYKGKVIDSMFTARSPAVHKSLKTPVAQFFSMSSMRHYEPYVDENTAIFVETMRELEGQSVDLATWLQWYAFDVVAGVTFQRRFGFVEERKDVGGMISGLDEALNMIKLLGTYPEIDKPAKVLARYVMALLGRRDPLEGFLDISEENIARYDATGSKQHTDFLSQLRQKDAPLGPGDLQENLVNHLSNNLLAGSDTTAISLRACFYYILKTSKVYSKLLAEMNALSQNGQLSNPVTLEESLKMPYLQAVMKEAMRLHPGVGFPLERLVPEGGAMVCGAELAAGTIVSMSAAVTQVDTSVYGDDALEFRPERWLEASSEQLKVMDRSFLAFGHGARSCIGKNISLMEMGKFIPQIFRTFELAWSSPTQEWKTNTAWFWKQSDMHVTFKVRDSAQV